MFTLRPATYAFAVAAAAVLLPTHRAFAEAEGESQPQSRLNETACRVTQVQYDVAANLQITGTTMGAGDGVYRVGPGKVRLRFDNGGGHQTVTLVELDLRQDFTVVSQTLFWSTSVVSHVDLRAQPALQAPVAEGTLENRRLHWKGQAQNVHSDGTLTCAGSMCGKFGAPPAGVSEVHVGPTSIELKPFEFSRDMKTFTMPFALVSASEAPKQRTLVSIAGSEAGRTCAAGE